MPVTYNTRNPAVKRLLKEAQELSEPTELYYAQPLEDNLFEWHFTIRGPEDTEFHGGLYHGRILLPSEYPMKPPNIVLLTPNGRFETHRKICLSISGYHPESWRPSWSIRTALLAIIGFMPTEGAGAIGSLNQSKEERQSLARRSQSFICSNCGPTRDLLRPLTDASRSITKEASEAAAQISMSSENFPNSKSESDQKTPTGSNSSPSSEVKSETPTSAPAQNPSTSSDSQCASSQPSTSQIPTSSSSNTKEIVKPLTQFPVFPQATPGFNPWSGYMPFSPAPTDFISSNQPVYWLCFPVYYPMMPSPNETSSINNANLPTSSSASSFTASSNGERVPLSFSEWLQQLKEKAISDDASRRPITEGLKQSPVGAQAAAIPPASTSSSVQQEHVPNESATTKPAEDKASASDPKASRGINDRPTEASSFQNLPDSVTSVHDSAGVASTAGSPMDAQNKTDDKIIDFSKGDKSLSCAENKSSSSALHHEAVPSDQSPESEVPTVDDKSALGGLKSPTEALATDESSKPDTKISTELPVRQTQSDDGVLSRESDTSTPELPLPDEQLRHRPDTDQLETSVVDSFVIGNRRLSGNSSRPESRSTAVVSSSYRAVNLCALGVALALFLVVMRRLALMIHGV